MRWIARKNLIKGLCHRSKTSRRKQIGTKRPVITKHLKNIFTSRELTESVLCSKLECTTQHGLIKNKTQKSEVKIYNLDTIISVGYRVNSKEATQFRQWATQRLKNYLEDLKMVA